MSDTTEERVLPKTYAYCGQRVDTKGKRVYAWYCVEDRRDYIFGKNILDFQPSVGQTYTVHEVEGAGSIKVAGQNAPRYEGSYDDPAEVGRWVVKDEVAKEQLASKSTATKAGNADNPVDDLLRSVTAAARKMNDTERRALLSLLAGAVMYA